MPGSSVGIPNALRVLRALPKALHPVVAAPGLAREVLDPSRYENQASLSALYRLPHSYPHQSCGSPVQSFPGVVRLNYLDIHSHRRYLAGMSRQAAPIELSAEEDVAPTTRGRSRTLPLRQVQRAQIVRLAAAAMDSQDIAATLGVSRPTVQLWRQRFLALRVRGLENDAPRPGRLAQITERQVQAVLEATLHTTPPNATHRSTRTHDGESLGPE